MYKEFLSQPPVSRKRILENRDLINGLRCNRNERVEYWEEDFLKQLTNGISAIDHTVYPDLSSLYNAIAKYESIEQENLLIGSGIDGIIKNIFENYTVPGMNIGVLSPTYAMYYVYGKLFKTNIKHVKYKISNFSLDKKQLLNTIKDIKLLFIPNPNQPIEDNLDNYFLEKVASKCLENDVLLVIDEAYYGFGCPTAKPLLKKFPNLLIMRTFSKAFGMPSIRVGYMMGESRLIKLLSQKRVSYETTQYSAHIAKKLIENINHINKYNNSLAEARKRIVEDIRNFGYRVNGNKANYILIDFLDEINKKKFAKKFLERKIYIKDNLDLWGFDDIYNGETKKLLFLTTGPYEKMQPVLQILNAQ